MSNKKKRQQRQGLIIIWLIFLPFLLFGIFLLGLAGDMIHSHLRALSWQPVTATLLDRYTEQSSKKSNTSRLVGKFSYVWQDQLHESTKLSFSRMYAHGGGVGIDDSSAPVTKVTGEQMLKTDGPLDYTLYTVNNFAAIASFGNYGLDVRPAIKDEQIFIPQHGAGNTKELAIASDMNTGGLYRIVKPIRNGTGTNTDAGYKCDTISGSSGSPVLATSSKKVIALHHLGGCPSGTVYSLHNRSGGSADNIVKTYQINVGSADSLGTWKLRMVDAASSDIGKLNNWKITFTN